MRSRRSLLVGLVTVALAGTSTLSLTGQAQAAPPPEAAAPGAPGSPGASAAPAAPTPVERARAIVAQMTLDEKISQLHGIRDDASDIFRHVPAIPRLGVPALMITNGPAGVSTGGSRKPENQPFATALPAPISLAASFDVKQAL